LIAPVLITAVGFGIDIANISSARARLQNATDAAVLTAGRQKVLDAERKAMYEAHLAANLQNTGIQLLSTDLTQTTELTSFSLTGQATGKVGLYFMQQFAEGLVSVSATATLSTKSSEIALVLDNTGSMGAAGIAALKKASHALVNAVESGGNGHQVIRFGLVPFVTAVNIKGEGYDPAWIDQNGLALYNGWNFLDDALRQRRTGGERLSQLPTGFGSNSTGGGNGGGQACNNNGQGAPAIAMRERCRLADEYPHHLRLFARSGTTWKGCVEARPAPLNFTLAPPDPLLPETLFVPYFAADEPGNRRNDNGGNDGNNYNNSWLHDEVSGTDAERQRSTLKYIDPNASLMRVHEAAPLTIGPNRACPTPVVPLTADLAKVRANIDAMQFWNGSGTNIAEGLAWGWRVLSPEAPYTEATPMGAPNVSKFLILMTDGRNVSFGAKTTVNRSDYGAYNFLGTGRIDGKTDQGQAETVLNTWTLQMCSEMKRQGVQVFTVVYNETAASVHDMFRTCASRPENFYMTNNTASLEAAFAKIGRAISSLRLTH
jgi:Flp pilus assembly protein TadG